MLFRSGVEPAITGVAPYSALNKVTGPVAGKRAVYVYSVNNKKDSEAEFDQAAEIDAWTMSMKYRLSNEAMKALINKAKIEDNRIKFY